MTMKTQELFRPAIDRYMFDFHLCTAANGWAQVDTSQDASYFGTWANPFDRMIVAYAEGDIHIKRAGTDEEFVKALRELKVWNEKAGHEFKGIDGMCNDGIIQAFTSLGLADLLH